MAEFNTAVEYLNTYLTDKRTSLSGATPRRWFTTGHDGDLSGMRELFSTSVEDDLAFQAYNAIKDPEGNVPIDKESKHRLRLLFMAAATQTVRKQYMSGLSNNYRTIQDTYRYEMSNIAGVKSCLKKFQNTTEKMGGEST